MKKIIFVCLGNICRSPLAEGVAKDEIKKRGLTNIIIDSAGTSTYHNGEHPCKKSIDIALKNGVDISKQISQHITEFDLNSYNLIVALDELNFRDLKMEGYSNIKKLGDFGINGEDIPDPYYFHSRDKLQKVYKLIVVSVNNLLDNLNNL